MQTPQGDPIWVELGKVDFFLEHLARAVEQGKLDVSVYDSVAAPYWARRAEIVSALEPSATTPAPVDREADTQAGVVPVAPRTERGDATAAPASHQPGVAPQPAQTRGAFAASSEPLGVPSPPVEMNWTGLLLGVGSLLVIVAAAVFAIATWDTYSVAFRIAFLGVLTVGFYVAGVLVRTRLDLETGGAALLAVASAMLLFDGWIIIDGYGLDEAWWLVWLAMCSAVYWLTEIRVSGRFFGVIGAAAQVAWVWLAGEGFEWPPDVTFAVLALVAVAWAVSGRLAQDRKHITSLSSVLRYAAPVAVVVAVGGVAVSIVDQDVVWRMVASSAVVAVCASATFDSAGLPRGIAGLAQVPLLLALTALFFQSSSDEWVVVVLLAAIAVADIVYEVGRGDWGHALAGLAAEVLAVFTLAEVFDASPDVTIGMMAVLAGVWIVSTRFIDADEAPDWAPGLGALKQATLGAGYGLLALATVALVVATDHPFDPGGVSTGTVVLALVVTALWFVAGLARPERVGGIVGLLMSLYATAMLVSRIDPSAHASYYAAALLAVLAIIAVARDVWERLFLVPQLVTALVARLAAAGVVVVAVVFALAAADLWDAGVAVMFAVSAGFRALDAFKTGGQRWSLAAVTPSLAFSAGVVAALLDGIPGSGADAFSAVSAGAAFILVLLGLALLRVEGFSHAWILGAGGAALVACASAVGEPGLLTGCLVLAAMTWAAAAYTVLPELAGLSVLLLVFAVFSMLAYIDPAGWVTVVAVLAASALAVAPVGLVPGGIRAPFDRVVAASAATSVFGPLGLLALGITSSLGFPLAGWADIGEQGLVLALLALSAYGFGAAVVWRFPPATYGGGAALLLAALVEMNALDIGGIEPRTTVIAIYVVWLGARLERQIGPEGRLPFDIIATLIALVPPTLAALFAGSGPGSWEHLAWALGLSIAAIALGVVFRVRSYLFGGAIALLVVAVGRSWFYVMTYWWIPLGIIGIGIIVVALTAMRRRDQLSATSQRVSDTFADWR